MRMIGAGFSFFSLEKRDKVWKNLMTNGDPLYANPQIEMLASRTLVLNNIIFT